MVLNEFHPDRWEGAVVENASSDYDEGVSVVQDIGLLSLIKMDPEMQMDRVFDDEQLAEWEEFFNDCAEHYQLGKIIKLREESCQS